MPQNADAGKLYQRGTSAKKPLSLIIPKHHSPPNRDFPFNLLFPIEIGGGAMDVLGSPVQNPSYRLPLIMPNCYRQPKRDFTFNLLFPVEIHTHLHLCMERNREEDYKGRKRQC